MTERTEPAKARATKRREYKCAKCSRRLPHKRWVYSKQTGARYCFPGDPGSCWSDRRKRRGTA